VNLKKTLKAIIEEPKDTEQVISELLLEVENKLYNARIKKLMPASFDKKIKKIFKKARKV